MLDFVLVIVLSTFGATVVSTTLDWILVSTFFVVVVVSAVVGVVVTSSSVNLIKIPSLLSPTFCICSCKLVINADDAGPSPDPSLSRTSLISFLIMFIIFVSSS